MKNLFNYATKELSQDAFLRWLFENYNCENEEVVRICKKIFNAFTNNDNTNTALDFSKIDKNSLKTVAQWKNIDVSIWFTIQGEEYLIVIEDKTTTEEHCQLKNYNEKIKEHLNWLIKNNKRPIKQVYKIFYKTAEISGNKKDKKTEKGRVFAEGWEIFDIQKIYELFKDVKNTRSEILDGYAEHIRDINDTYNNFENVSFEKWLYNNTIFQAYAQKRLKSDYSDCYRGIYVWASTRKEFHKFTMEILFEFRHWQITAKIQYWRNEESVDINKLRNYMRTIDLDDCLPFTPNTAYGKKRLARIIKDSENTNKEYIFNNYMEFDSWIFDCIKAFEKITSKVKEEDFLILLK